MVAKETTVRDSGVSKQDKYQRFTGKEMPHYRVFGCQIYFIFIEILDWSFNLQNEESMGQEEEKRRADLLDQDMNVSTSFE